MTKTDASVIESVLPQNLDAEKAVLGNILFDQDTIYKVMDVLRSDDFYAASHKVVYDAMIELNKKAQPIDVLTLTEYLKNGGMLERAGGESYVASLVDLAPVTTNIVPYANIIKEKALRRELILNSMKIAKMGYDPSLGIDAYLDDSVKMIFDITQKRFTTTLISSKELIEQVYHTIEERRKNKMAITGVPTGFEAIDKITSGLQPSDLIIIAARPGVGKTSLALNIAMNASVKHQHPVAIFSLEMSKQQLAYRLLSTEAKVRYMSIQRGYLQFSEFQRLNKAASVIQSAPIVIDDKSAISMLELRAKARRLKSENKLKLLIVDYLQIMEQPKDAESVQAAIASLTGSLKALAKDLNVPVLVLSQLNREGEKRDFKRPQLSDLRGSGAIEQDADLIMFIHRPELYARDDDPKGKGADDSKEGAAEIIIAKHRNGPTTNIKLTFIGEYTRFENYASGRVELDDG
ncbi:MAG: replicative DNA helicase [Deltaproteobacteria bacterium]|nr:replicative DNA helicase [Deltaproteobacteria bacterium]MCL5277544.1 replicative DNA helicase [Deltaproteobacteria bacterium]